MLIIVYFIYSATSAKKTENPDREVNHKTNNGSDIPGDSSIKKNPDMLEHKPNMAPLPGADVLRDTSIKRGTHKSGAKKNFRDSAAGADVPKE